MTAKAFYVVKFNHNWFTKANRGGALMSHPNLGRAWQFTSQEDAEILAELARGKGKPATVYRVTIEPVE